jgi:hypothetical protein
MGSSRSSVSTLFTRGRPDTREGCAAPAAALQVLDRPLPNVPTPHQHRPIDTHTGPPRRMRPNKALIGTPLDVHVAPPALLTAISEAPGALAWSHADELPRSAGGWRLAPHPSLSTVLRAIGKDKLEGSASRHGRSALPDRGGPDERYTDGTNPGRRRAHLLKQKPRLSGAFVISGRQDLNLRPPGPQPGALPDCATPRGQAIITAARGPRPRPRADAVKRAFAVDQVVSA